MSRRGRRAVRTLVEAAAGILLAPFRVVQPFIRVLRVALVVGRLPLFGWPVFMPSAIRVALDAVAGPVVSVPADPVVLITDEWVLGLRIEGIIESVQAVLREPVPFVPLVAREVVNCEHCLRNADYD